MYYCVPIVFLGYSLPTLGPTIPVPNQSWFRFPLHAHVLVSPSDPILIMCLTFRSLATGSTSHKTVQSDVSRILWYYYNNSLTLFIFCLANETFFFCLYLNVFWTNSIAQSLPFLLTLTHKLGFPVMVGWVLENVSWPQLIAGITFPICAGKQVINVVQFWKASKIVSHTQYWDEMGGW